MVTFGDLCSYACRWFKTFAYPCACRCRTPAQERATLLWHFCRRNKISTRANPAACKCRG